MKFNLASEVDAICWQMKEADFPRGLNRARINDLFNGVPPYTAEEVERNNIAINVNDLSSTRLGHDARSQFYQAFLKPGKFFTASSDMGPSHKRLSRSSIVTTEINSRMKDSVRYFETYRSKFAGAVLHGIGPAAWDNRDRWCPRAKGIEDILIPANTELDMENLPFFSICHSYTAPQLIRLTHTDKRDPGWNMKLVEECLKWIDRETMALLGSNWPEVWSPEKLAERVKGDGGFYVGDAVPTIDVFDFYFWNDDQKEAAWNRRMILDSWSTPSMVNGKVSMNRRSGFDFGKGEFLFNPKGRKYARKLSELVSFIFSDLSAVAPFRYHSIRSFGFLVYSICHLQNRLRCKFNEAVFEALLQYIRVRSADDAERALKIELANRGIIDESVQFLSPQERWQVNSALVELGLSQNDQLIREHSSSWTQNQDFSRDRTEKTKFQVMAEVNASTSLMSAGLTQAYQYQKFEFNEVLRRFFRKNSADPDVVSFQAACLRQGVPENMLVPEAWTIEPERVMGAGNKTLEMAITEQLMAFRNLYDPEPQRDILRDFTLAITDDPGRAERYVPDNRQKVSDSMHDAQLATSRLMMGLPLAVKTGYNHIEYVESLLVDLQLIIGKANQRGGMATVDQIEGMGRIAQHIEQHIMIIARDQAEKRRVTEYRKVLSKLMNTVRAFAQRLKQAMAKGAAAGNGQPGPDPKDAARVQAMLMQAKAKAENTRESHAQRTAQRQIQFEMEEKREDQRLRAELARENMRHRMDLNQKAGEAATEIGLSRIKALNEPPPTRK